MGNKSSTPKPTPEELLDKWKTDREAETLNYANVFSDRIWDAFAISNEKTWLWKKIAVAFYGLPEKETSADDLGLSKERKKMIDNVVKKCIDNSVDKKEVCIAVIFIFVYLSDGKDIQLPLIRVKTHNNRSPSEIPNNVFIDTEGRVYKSWTEYKEDSNFDKHYQLGPKNGYYSLSSNCWELIPPVTSAQVKHGLDIASTVTEVASGVGTLTGIVLTIIPVTAPIGAVVLTGSIIAGVPGAAYGVGRSIGKLVDRGQHGQSISLANSSARAAWLGTVCSATGLIMLPATKALGMAATAGRIAPKAVRVAFTTIGIAGLALSGIGIGNSVYDFIDQNRAPNALEALQITLSVLLLGHSLVTFKTASGVIKHAQNKKIAAARGRLDGDTQAVYDSVRSEFQQIGSRTRTMHGNAEFIRYLRAETINLATNGANGVTVASSLNTRRDTTNTGGTDEVNQWADSV